jgi:hypothetical protein
LKQAPDHVAGPKALPIRAEARTIARGLLTFALIVLALWTAGDFLTAVGWAAIIAIAIRPIYAQVAPIFPTDGDQFWLRSCLQSSLDFKADLEEELPLACQADQRHAGKFVDFSIAPRRGDRRQAGDRGAQDQRHAAGSARCDLGRLTCSRRNWLRQTPVLLRVSVSPCGPTARRSNGGPLAADPRQYRRLVGESLVRLAFACVRTI